MFEHFVGSRSTVSVNTAVLLQLLRHPLMLVVCRTSRYPQAIGIAGIVVPVHGVTDADGSTMAALYHDRTLSSQAGSTVCTRDSSWSTGPAPGQGRGHTASHPRGRGQTPKHSSGGLRAREPRAALIGEALTGARAGSSGALPRTTVRLPLAPHAPGPGLRLAKPPGEGHGEVPAAGLAAALQAPSRGSPAPAQP